jgi:Flp pilus assembly protein TadD
MITQNIDLILTEIETLKANQDYQKAKIVARSALVEHTDDYRLYEELADISLFEENLDEAETMIQTAEKLHPESGTGIYLRGYIAVARGDHDTAIKTLTRANELFPNNPEILRNLGWAFVLSGSIDK